MKPKAIFILDAGSYGKIYSERERAAIAEMCDVCAESQTKASIKEHPEMLSEVEIIFSGWGAPVMDEAFLAAAPRLRAVFYGAGTVKYFTTPAFWERGITLTSSWGANAVPVSEFALAEILLSLKLSWRFMQDAKTNRRYPARTPVPGIYGSTVALISLGMIGRLVARLLRNFQVNVIAYDPFATPEAAAELGVRLVSLEEAFATADVVSLHTPWLKETENLITGRLIASMKRNATFINTARGAVVAEEEMLDVLERRPDLTALLDVTYPEPPGPASRIYTLPNVMLTPHIAGSLDGECQRMGQYAVDECRRYLAGEPLQWQVTRKMAETLA